MPETTAAEAALAIFAGRERAAAIFGDLTEMAATRGRLWFFAAYARTLVSLTGRIVLALAIATVGRQIIANSTGTYFSRMFAASRTTDAPFLFHLMAQLLYGFTSTLWFVLPFAAVRYGLRDRFVRLAFAVAVGNTVALLFFPVASRARDIATVSLVATLALVAAAFTSRTWRKPFEVLGWTGAAALLANTAVNAVDSAIISHHPAWWASHFFRHYGAMLIFRSSLLAVVFVCARLHRRLLDVNSSGDSYAKPA